MTMKKSIVTILVITLLMCSTAVDASNMMFSSIRQKSMGGAGVAITYDEHALHKNPAGLTQATLDFDLPRIQLSRTTEMMNKQNQLQEFMNAVNSNNSDDISEQASQLGLPLDINMNIAVNPVLAFTMPQFGIAAFAEAQISGRLQNSVAPNMEYSAEYEAAPMIGYAKPFDIMGKSYDIGISGYYAYRGSVYDPNTGENKGTIDMLSGLNNIDSPDFLSATGIGINLGMLTDIGTPLGDGKLGFAINNAFSSLQQTITSSSDNGSSSIQETSAYSLPVIATVGLGVDTTLPWIGEVTTAIDYRLIAPETSLFKRLFMGVEKKVLWDRVFLRGGISQGFIVGGVGVDLWILHFDYAYFAEELGSEIGVKPVNYHVFQAGILF
jgi:hypothetical protein